MSWFCVLNDERVPLGGGSMIRFLFLFYGNGVDMDNVFIYVILRFWGIGIRGNGAASSTGVSFANGMKRSSGDCCCLGYKYFLENGVYIDNDYF